MKEDVCAVIDFGSNTVTLAVYRMDCHAFRLLLKQKAALGIIRYVEDGVLSQEGLHKALITLEELKRTAEALTQRIYCFATASLRGVRNAQDVINHIRSKAGIEVELISGEKEAYYDYLGLMQHLPRIRNAAALDIGGGSMEIIHIRNGRLHQCVSLPTGSLKLSIDYAEGRFPSAKESGEIETGIDNLLSSVVWLGEIPGDTIYTIGGTARAVTKLHKAIFSYSVTKKDYSYPVSDLNPLLLYLEDDKHYQRLEPVIPGRMQTIVPGIIALRSVAKKAGAKTVVLSKYGVREGYLLDKEILGGET
jgi:exopolyphosphatase/guanosine-5'-triphosphate,3'-diphosphate pyrophosphatase